MKTRYPIMALILCMAIFAACDGPENNTNGNENGNTNKTFVEFQNLEQYQVTVYSDSQRNQAIAEIPALGSATVAATPNSAGASFYPTFHLDLFGISGVSIPYNGPAIIAVVEENKTNNVPIPKLQSIQGNSAYIKIINNSNVPLTLQQGNAERTPIGGGSTVVSAGQSVAFEVNPGPSSAYSIMGNTTTPVAFPESLGYEFRRGIIYSLTYNGTSLTRVGIGSVLNTIPPAAPENVRVESLSSTSVQITWNEVYGAYSYRVYRASGSETGTYTQVRDIRDGSAALSYTDTGLSAGQAYYYKVSAVNSRGNEGAQSAAASSIMAPGSVRVTTVTANSVSLAWYTFSGASGYNVYRSTSETGTYNKINTTAITVTEFTDTSVSAYTEYWYKVSVITGVTESMQSSPVSVSTGTVVPGSGIAAKLAWLQSNAESGNLYAITVDIDEYIVPQTLSYNGKSGITIALNGGGTMRTINLSANGSLFTVGNGVTLVLDNNITLNGRSANNDSLVYINRGGSLIMNTGSKITGNSNSSNGGGVYNSGTFTMNGGEISSNTAPHGGGVYGDFTMNGGKISGNTATSTNIYSGGGGVYINQGTFTMNGGEISGNTASNNGGGVYAYQANIIINGGKLLGNNASNGGGVYLYGNYYSGNDIRMKDGEILGNTASDRGGGVYKGSYVSIFIGGGVIYGNSAIVAVKNTAENDGAAFYSVGGNYDQYGTFSGDTFYRSGDLSTTDTTIRIVNGNLFTE